VKNRITLTAAAINHARACVFLVSGAGKAEAVRLAIEGQAQDPRKVPARLIQPVNGRLVWFLDRAAAAELTMARQGIVSHEE
jgi:6-phosphogluconolactonase